MKKNNQIEQIVKLLKDIVEENQQYDQLKKEMEYQEKLKTLDNSEKEEKEKKEDNTSQFDSISMNERTLLYNKLKRENESYLDKIEYLHSMNNELLTQMNTLYIAIKEIYDDLTIKMTEAMNDKINFEQMIRESISKLIKLRELKTEADVKFYEEQIRKSREEMHSYNDGLVKLRTDIFGTPNDIQLPETIHSFSRSAEYKQQIEQWTQMKIGTIVFDSAIDSYSQGSSVFDSKIIGRKNICLLIESVVEKKNITVGMCLFNSISQHFTGQKTAIQDEKAFVFSFRNNCKNKYAIQSKDPSIFYLYPSDHTDLFQIGMDIKIYKNGETLCLQNEHSIFNYGKAKNALFGNIGHNCFSLKRIVVFQMN